MDERHSESAIRSVDRALVLLDLLAKSAPLPLRVVDVAERLAVTAASVADARHPERA
jgi:DNA-binding IclR family transcriptional regulator